MIPIDLRSDTVTLPTTAMRRAMSIAPLGDDSLDGDPTVRRLERISASIMGKEDALFVVSGTMGNLVASLAHGCNGGEALVDEHAHIVHSEAGGISRLAGLVCKQVPSIGGEMDLARVGALVRNEYSRQGPPTAMVVVESSHNYSGGTVPSLDYMRALHQLARKASVPVHLDGARVFNAALALGVEVRDLAASADSVTFCLSKGLSAPMGSVLTGSAAFIERARMFRRMVGGGLRQAGIVAAAGIVAMEQMTSRLEEDNKNARILWSELCNAAPELVSPTPPQTNIVLIHLNDIRGQRSFQEWLTILKNHGIQARARDASTLRLVTHRHITAATAAQAARNIIRAMQDEGRNVTTTAR